MTTNYDAKLSDMIGKTMASVENIDNETLRFIATDGAVYRLYHSQDCCESVAIEDITGSLDDLVGVPLLMADCVDNDPPPLAEGEYAPESYTWTFYKFGTLKGYVDVRWLGTSNGYYSESVSFVQDE